MIVYDEGETLLLITQPDHAHFTGELLSLWRADGLAEHPRRAEILFAGREHDNGWREEDAAPRWNAEEGRPHDFLTMPQPARIALWERGTARFAGSHPYASLLIVRHARNLYRERREEPEWQDFFAYLDELASGLLEATGVSEEEVAADYRFLDFGDLISLVVCNRWNEPFSRHGWSGAYAADAADAANPTLHLDPLPLAGATAFAIPCRRIPKRPYRGDADLGGELAAARWETLPVRVAAPR